MGWNRSFATNPGSARGFSQPLGGLRKRTFHGLVSCRSQILDCLSSSFPLAEIAHLFPGRLCSLEVPHPRAERDLSDLVTVGFPSPPRTQCFPVRAS